MIKRFLKWLKKDWRSYPIYILVGICGNFIAMNYDYTPSNWQWYLIIAVLCIAFVFAVAFSNTGETE